MPGMLRCKVSGAPGHQDAGQGHGAAPQPSPSFWPHCVSPLALPTSFPPFFPLHVCELNHLALLD